MDLQSANRTKPASLADIGNRIRAWWPAKMFGTTLGMAVFFYCYFELLHHPRFAVTEVPITIVDRWVGFQPLALPLYLSLWVYISLAPTFLCHGRVLLSYAAASVLLSGLGLAIFFFWPTTTPTAGIDWSQHPSMRFLKAADTTGNACPSLHVAFAVFTAVWFERLLREMGAGRRLRALNWLWCVGILYSTMAVRQHVFIDVVTGTILGLVVVFAHLEWLRRRPAWAAAR